MKGFLLNLLNTNHENQTPESWPGALQCDDGIPGRRRRWNLTIAPLSFPVLEAVVT